MSKEKKDVFARAEEFVALFSRGAEFTKQILHENERLRGRLNSVEDRQTHAAQDNVEWEKLREELLERITGLESEKRDVLDRLQAVEEENRQFADRYLEIEEENNNLANLYVASYQLHSTLELSEVLKTIIEIVINLIGAEVFAVYVLDEKTNQLSPVASEGKLLSARDHLRGPIAFRGPGAADGLYSASDRGAADRGDRDLQAAGAEGRVHPSRPRTLHSAGWSRRDVDLRGAALRTVGA
jgi:hypothetical protein